MKNSVLMIIAALMLLGPVMAEETKPSATPAPATTTGQNAAPEHQEHTKAEKPMKKSAIKKHKSAMKKAQ